MDADPPLPSDVPTLHGMVRGLRAENADLRTRVAGLETTVQELRAELAALRAELERARAHRFGRWSERTPKPPKAPGEAPAKRRHDHGRSPLPAHLDRRDTVLDLSPRNAAVPAAAPTACASARPRPSNSIATRPRTSCGARSARHTPVSGAPRRSRPKNASGPPPRAPSGRSRRACAGRGCWPRSSYAKFLDHLPLHRQVARIGRAGVAVAPSTLGDWIRQSATLLTPLYQLMLGRVRECPVIWSDDTRSRFARPGERVMPHGHFWVAIGDPTAPYTLFHFTTGYDAASGPGQFLPGFRGYLHADCLSQYNGLFAAGARHVACWSHARRKFLDAGAAGAKAVERIHRLYHLEHQLPPPDTPEHIAARHVVRQSQAIPILDDLKAWLDATLADGVAQVGLGGRDPVRDESLGGVRPVHRGRATVAR